jgi:hypothetical protein
MNAGVAKVLREPLVHFLVIGAVLFGIERGVRRGDAAPPGARAVETPAAGDARVVVDAEVRSGLVEQWTSSHGRAPTDAELEELVTRWIDDELLYREGLARGLDRADPRVRERIAFKMAHVVKARVVVPEPSEADLRAWFEQHAERWAKTDLYDFVHVFVKGDDEAARARAAELLAKLSAGSDGSGLGDPFSGGRRYRRRKLDDLAKAFGDEFVKGMAEQPEGSWALRRSRHGMHLVRIERKTAASAPELSAVLPDVRRDWEAARRQAGFEEEMRAIRARWDVVRQ